MKIIGNVFRRGLLMAVATLLLTGAAQAKRVAPAPVKPLVHAGVRYEAPHFFSKDDKPEKGGHVQAFDKKTGKLLWVRQVYQVKVDPALEGDVQDVFITSLKLRGRSKLVVQNERKERFEMDLASGKVRALGKLGPRTELPTP